jgi:hypothetical protein
MIVKQCKRTSNSVSHVKSGNPSSSNLKAYARQRRTFATQTKKRNNFILNETGRTRAENGFWKVESNHKKYIDWLANKLGIKELDDWYKVGFTDIRDNGGASILSYYGNSVHRLVSAIMPHKQWLPWKFSQVADGYWKSLAHQRQFADWIADSLNMESYEGWYMCTHETIEKAGGAKLLHLYKNSVVKMVEELYPEFSWDTWEFKFVPQNYWSDINNQKRFLDRFAEVHGIKDHTQWYKVDVGFVIRGGGATLLSYYDGSLIKALCHIYSGICPVLYEISLIFHVR